MTMRKILVTSALPYANGPLHLGHMVEHIQMDIWVRVQKMLGHHCISVCGDDAHGTPIMLKAEQLKLSPEQLTAQIKQSHEQDFKAFGVHYDCYHSTHSPENQQLVYEIYARLEQAGSIVKRTIKQAYDPVKSMFLPDRFIKGTCPKCKALDQYGDSCEVCGAIYQPTELIEPKSVLSGAKPIEKESEHYFFDLPKFESLLKTWLATSNLQPEVTNKLSEWFASGLKQWDISRDAPYFGFPIPNNPDKYFYVWLDAPIGYMASFKKYCTEHAIDFDDYWHADSATELYHFVGKDIVYFHALFWPAILASSQHRLPTNLFVHGFLTVNGQKMSKSRGTFIEAAHYLKHFNPEYLRYYFASKISRKIEDIDLNLNDFMLKINADLVGKIVNIASRCAQLLKNYHHNLLASRLVEPDVYQSFISVREKIMDDYIKQDYAQAMRQIMILADKTNQYIDAAKPWSLAKDSNNLAAVQAICTMGINLFRVLITYLAPVLPVTANKAADFLKLDELTLEDLEKPLLNRTINNFEPLMQRIEMSQINALLTPATKAAMKPDDNTISIEDFNKVDLRVAKIIAAEAVEGADKLLKLSLDIGQSEPKQVFAGIKSAYNPEQLIGKLTVMVVNLAPRTMRFGVSEGMVLAASKEGSGLFLLEPDAGAESGMKIK